jgi:cobalamin biosynthesis protein CbiG
MERSPLPFICIPGLWVGLGCRRGTPTSVFEQGLRQVCQDHELDWSDIAGVATLNLKQTEPGLLAFSLDQSWPLIYFTRADLDLYTVPNPSGVVNAAVGVSSVCEASALRAATQARLGTLSSMLVVPKQIFQGPSDLGAVTIAIAQACLLPEKSEISHNQSLLLP